MVTILSADNEAAAISQAVAELRAGRPVAMPTETVYGLAADAANGEAVAEVFAMKERPAFNPLICHVDGLAMAERFGQLCDVSRRLAHAFWPGPLTIIAPLAENAHVHDLVTAGLATVGLRCPRGIARAVISALGRPLAAPSANKSGRISPTTAQHVAEEHSDSDLVVIDGGPSLIGLESAIVRVDARQVTLLRSGGIPAEAIEAVAGLPVVAATNNAIEAPGMMMSHYAPNALVKPNCKRLPKGAAWLGFGNRRKPKGAVAAINLSAESNLVAAAAGFYAALKELDRSGAKIICVSPIPIEGLGVAINDRLKRAAAPRVNTGDRAS